MFRSLRRIDSGDREPYALEVLAAVLDADENGRLTAQLVRGGARVADSAGASYDMTSRGPALFLLDGTPAQGTSSSQFEQALRAQVKKIADEGVRDSELRRVKTQYVASQVYRRDSIMGQAMELASLEIVGFSHRDADRILENIRSVTAAEVQAVASKYFGDDALTVVTLLPQPLSAKPRSRRPTRISGIERHEQGIFLADRKSGESVDCHGGRRGRRWRKVVCGSSNGRRPEARACYLCARRVFRCLI